MQTHFFPDNNPVPSIPLGHNSSFRPHLQQVLLVLITLNSCVLFKSYPSPSVAWDFYFKMKTWFSFPTMKLNISRIMQGTQRFDENMHIKIHRSEASLHIKLFLKSLWLFPSEQLSSDNLFLCWIGQSEAISTNYIVCPPVSTVC